MQGIIPRLPVETGDGFVNSSRHALVLYAVDCMLYAVDCMHCAVTNRQRQDLIVPIYNRASTQ